jgi:glycine/D-amino acid oxidase-like deaminating enzyme
MDRDVDVVVVGAGIVGCATAYYLARRGLRVVVIERGTVAGEQSRKNWGFVRQQGRDPHEVPLMMESNRIWRGLERELGADIEWVQGGNLALAADARRMALFEEWLPVARQFGLDTRLLRPRELAAAGPVACTRRATAMPTRAGPPTPSPARPRPTAPPSTSGARWRASPCATAR